MTGLGWAVLRRTRLLRYLVLGVVMSMSALLAYQQWA